MQSAIVRLNIDACKLKKRTQSEKNKLNKKLQTTYL